MSIFCLLWMPLFYLFRRSLAAENSGSGGVWALLLGSVAALVQFFMGNFVNPGGFGFSRWFSACLDIIALPALLPLAVYLLFVVLRAVSEPFDFAGFMMLWLMPYGAIRAVNWSATGDPALLILVPLLWTAIAAGIPFFIDYIIGGSLPRSILCGAGIIALPFAAITSWWALYSQIYFLGFGLLAAVMVPLVISTVISWKTS